MSAKSVSVKSVSVLAAVAALLAVLVLWGTPQAHAAGVSYVERSWNGSSVVSTTKTLSEGHVRLHDRVVASDGNGFALCSSNRGAFALLRGDSITRGK